ncbi:hypothetical protein ABIE56_000292 [Luteibacter sp. 621]
MRNLGKAWPIRIAVDAAPAARRHAMETPECVGQMRLVEKSARSGDVPEREVGALKQGCSMAKPRIEHIGIWCQAEGGLERAMEVVDRQTGDPCEISRSQRLVEMRGHVRAQAVAHGGCEQPRPTDPRWKGRHGARMPRATGPPLRRTLPTRGALVRNRLATGGTTAGWPRRGGTTPASREDMDNAVHRPSPEGKQCLIGRIRVPAFGTFAVREGEQGRAAVGGCTEECGSGRSSDQSAAMSGYQGKGSLRIGAGSAGVEDIKHEKDMRHGVCPVSVSGRFGCRITSALRSKHAPEMTAARNVTSGRTRRAASLGERVSAMVIATPASLAQSWRSAGQKPRSFELGLGCGMAAWS